MEHLISFRSNIDLLSKEEFSIAMQHIDKEKLINVLFDHYHQFLKLPQHNKSILNIIDVKEMNNKIIPTAHNIQGWPENLKPKISIVYKTNP